MEGSYDTYTTCHCILPNTLGRYRRAAGRLDASTDGHSLVRAWEQDIELRQGRSRPEVYSDVEQFVIGICSSDLSV